MHNELRPLSGDLYILVLAAVSHIDHLELFCFKLLAATYVRLFTFNSSMNSWKNKFIRLNSGSKKNKKIKMAC